MKGDPTGCCLLSIVVLLFECYRRWMMILLNALFFTQQLLNYEAAFNYHPYFQE